MIFVLLSMNTIAQDEGRFDVSMINRRYDCPNQLSILYLGIERDFDLIIMEYLELEPIVSPVVAVKGREHAVAKDCFFIELGSQKLL